MQISFLYPPAPPLSLAAAKPLLPPHLAQAERVFADALKFEDLDQAAQTQPRFLHEFRATVAAALANAYDEVSASVADRFFLQRVLYRANRLKFFWYDDLSNYRNEQSVWLNKLRAAIECKWQRWEMAQLDQDALRRKDVRSALIERAQDDLDPAPSIDGCYFRDAVGEAGYRRLLEIASLDGLVEASQLSRTLGGVANEIHSMMTRLLVEEYGGGRLNRKHSAFFTEMLTAAKMETEPEYYFDRVPEEVLATINHSFLLSERKRHYLRYVGGLLYTEISTPAGFRNYLAAAERLGLSEAARGYWRLHIVEDERHGRWMLHDIALPLAKRYPEQAWELVLGYDQQKLLSARAGAAIAREARKAEAQVGAQLGAYV